MLLLSSLPSDTWTYSQQFKLQLPSLMYRGTREPQHQFVRSFQLCTLFWSAPPTHLATIQVSLAARAMPSWGKADKLHISSRDFDFSCGDCLILWWAPHYCFLPDEFYEDSDLQLSQLLSHLSFDSQNSHLGRQGRYHLLHFTRAETIRS